ncbi:MAG: histidine--tRNA ligase, partial [Candidatus Omnitrophica bacterium]|nr:histidine--tRNA ligase [Candidatus Omnitrophota bacterium]
MKNIIHVLRGTKDILPADAALWQFIESSARDIFAIYDYKEIRTPVIEEASLFIRSIGSATDIVQKEMYVFFDRGERSIALRPEATASIFRAFLENSLGQEKAVTKLFYIGPMFRSERPQKGRQRQFHQLGVEAIGSDNPLLDVEVISLAAQIMQALGIKDFNLNINSLGCQKDKANIIEKHRK